MLERKAASVSRSVARCSTSWLSTIIALVLISSSGVGYRVAAARFAHTRGSVSLHRGTLRALPLQIGEWSGAEAPLDELTIENTDTDDHVSRSYTRQGGTEAVSLFIGYGVRIRDLMPHRPEVCYTGVGWTLDESRNLELRTADGSTLPCQVHTFHRGGPGAQRIAVVNYYIVDGEYCADVSLLRSKAWKFKNKVGYVAQVQITSSADPLRVAEQRPACDFAMDSAPQIRKLLSDAVLQAAAGG